VSKFNKGQAIIEILISTSFLVLIISGGVRELISAEREATNDLLKARKTLWSYQFNDEILNRSTEYRMQDRLGIILNPIDQLVDIDLPMDNLWETRTPIYPMVRLNDSWQAKSDTELSSRPARLVVNNALSGSVVSVIQDGLSFLFLSEELSSDSLKFGYIDADVVPQEALIEECGNDC